MPHRLCPICRSPTTLHDVVDFNKSCEELNGKFIRPVGIPIYYSLCHACGFCFAAQMHDWTAEQFAQHVYNDDYIIVDPDYREARPKAQARLLLANFAAMGANAVHLDYGSGLGLLCAELRTHHWNCVSWDPFTDHDTAIDQLGTFDLITAFEVFEHVADIQGLMDNLVQLSADPCLILFSTALSDGKILPHKRLDWWYAAPRNGHISLFSRRSLAVLAQRHAFNFISFNDNFHAFFKNLPTWATHLLAAAPPGQRDAPQSAQ